MYSYLETSGGQSSNPYFNRNLWQLKTAVFLHWCLICAVPLKKLFSSFTTQFNLGSIEGYKLQVKNMICKQRNNEKIEKAVSIFLRK
jgi:hypothetical protein